MAVLKPVLESRMISGRYLKIEDKYYFPDKTVAFEDRGNKLKLETENHTVKRLAQLLLNDLCEYYLFLSYP